MTWLERLAWIVCRLISHDPTMCRTKLFLGDASPDDFRNRDISDQPNDGDNLVAGQLSHATSKQFSRWKQS
jgi:hypothetical protein